MNKELVLRLIREELIELRRKKEKKKRKKKKKKKSGKKDACYHKVRSRYDVWPSAYASGALVKCRKVGASNWGNSKEMNKDILLSMIREELSGILEKKRSARKKKADS